MIFIKKLTAFAAAISIATPATSFAQTPAQPSTYPHRKPVAAKRAAAAVAKPRATRKIAARPHRGGGRSPASFDETPTTPFKNPPAKIVKMGGKNYVYAERYTPRGRLLSTLLIGQNFREIKVDEFGTGTASKWDITKDETTMRSSQPYRGHFTKVEIEKHRAKDRLFLEFTYVPRIKRYRLNETFTKKYAVLNSDSVVFGDVCSLSNVQSLDDFRKIVDQLNGADTSGSELSCRLNAMAPLLFDKSCTGPTSLMKDSIGEITKGLADVMESGPIKVPKTFSASGYASSNSDTYLSCIEQHGMAEHSALIQGEMNDVLKSTQDQIDLALARKLITPEQRDAILNPKSPNCSVDSKITDQISKVRNSGNNGRPLFNCGVAPGLNVADTDAYRGNFVSGTNYNQIFLDATKTTMPDRMSTPGFTAESAYASTLLHEFIHSSGIDDEKLTLSAEKCCAGADAASKAAGCKDLDNRLVGTPTSYEAQNRFGGVINQGQFAVSETTINEFTNKKLSSGEDSQELMNRYKQYVAKKIEGDAAERAKLTDSDGKTLCSLTAPDDYCLQKQINFSQTKLIGYTDQFLTDQCPIVLQGQNRDDTSLCTKSKLKKDLEGYVTYVPNPAPVSGTTAALQPGDSTVPASQQASSALPKTDPYADLYSVQQGLTPEGPVNGAAAVITSNAGANSGPVKTGDGDTSGKTTTATGIHMNLAGMPLSGNGNTAGGSGQDVTTGAAPGQAGVPSASRPDGLDGSTSTPIMDNAGKVATTIGNTVSPNANAATPPDDGPEIVVTGHRLPKAPTPTREASSPDPAPAPAPVPWTPIAAAPVVTRSADSGSTSNSDSSTPALSYSAGGSAPAVVSAGNSGSAAGNSDLGAEVPGAAPSFNYGSGATGVPVVGGGGASSSGVAFGAVPSTGSGSAAGNDSGGGYSGRGPTSTQASQDKLAAANRSSAGVPTIQTPTQLARWFSLDYSRIKDRLGSTAVNVQLIKLRTEVFLPDRTPIGYVPRTNQPKPDQIYIYCQPRNLLLLSTRACQ